MLSGQAKAGKPRLRRSFALSSPAVAARPFTRQHAAIGYEGLPYFLSVNGILKPQARQLE